MRYILIVVLTILNYNSQQRATKSSTDFHLVWHDEFDGNGLDSTKWVFSSWHPFCTDSKSLASVKDGYLTLKAVKNPDQVDSLKKYKAGCIETRSRQDFLYGKLEVCAKFKSSTGAWPAIWLKPVRPDIHKGWPTCGEIDIMEHLNDDPFVHITIHSFNRAHKIKNTPSYHSTSPVNVNEFNIYGMVWTKDSISILVNRKLVYSYPRIETMGENEWPYDVPFFLLLNQTLGGWAGKIDDLALPASMEVDWVRYYLPN